MILEKIVSGGQTGVDRAALDVALELGIPCGGWCPKDRKAEDGPIPDRYPVEETPFSAYEVRTEWNVRDSDGTLILTIGEPTGGTATTIELAAAYERPCLILDLSDNPSPDEVLDWITENKVRNMNVAGPRASGCPGIHTRSTTFLSHLCVLIRRSE